jgi:alpha,alpha-trehalase
MLIDAVDSHLHRGAEQIIRPVWEGLAGFVDDAIKHAGDADQGIWEIRGEPQHFTESAVMCWLAADRGADLAQERGDTERATRWQQAADAVKADILERALTSRDGFGRPTRTTSWTPRCFCSPSWGSCPPTTGGSRPQYWPSPTS